MIKKYLSFVVLVLSFALFCMNIANAIQPAFSSDQEQQFINVYAKQYNIPVDFIKKTLKHSVFQYSTYKMQEDIMNAPVNYKGKSWEQYKKQFINTANIKRGVNFMCNNLDTLNQAEEDFGVPASVVVGVIGVETSFGSFTGKYRVLDTLTTLAFNSPRKIDYWQNELAKYLKLCYMYNINPEKLIGSIDGGYGLGQFMPSAYIDYAVTTQKGRYPDLLNQDDAIMSVANYLKQHGWKRGEMVTMTVKHDYKSCNKIFCDSNELKHKVYQWRENGVKTNYAVANTVPAELITFKNPKRKYSWLAFHNFYIIYTYNHSLKYAMVVNQLGEAVAKNVANYGCE
ncbi:MAG: lytic murein transglycosylase [Burkholderiales bacterium]|nr:lytic murein transglycosylase [Burkholderiales bacterium]